MFSEEEITFYRGLDIYSRSEALVNRFFKSKIDKSNHDYREHLRHVSEDFTNKKVKSLALLHDILEDTEVTSSDLLNLGYSKSEVSVLEILTNTCDNYEEYIDNILNSNNKIALNIKVKDLLHNMDLTRLKKITPRDIKRAKKYLNAYIKIIETLEGEEYDRY